MPELNRPGESQPREADAADARTVTSDTSVRQVFQSALRSVTIGLVILLVLGVGLGALISGTRGVWGALLGVAAAMVFSGTTVWAAWKTADADATTTGAIVLGSWLAKMIILVGALAALKDAEFYSKPVFAVVLLAGGLASAALDYLAIRRSRLPYVSPMP